MRRKAVTLSICLTTIIISASPASATPTPEAAWTALWSNKVAEAEQLFRSSLENDDDNPEVWRGLLLTQLLMGYDDKLVETIDPPYPSIPSKQTFSPRANISMEYFDFGRK